MKIKSVHIKNFRVLKDVRPEWVTACNEIEAAVGISLAKNQLAYQTATLHAAGAVPDMLKQILTKVSGVSHV